MQVQVFARLYNSYANVKLSKTLELDRYLGKIFGPLMKITLPVIKNAILLLLPLAKSILILLELTARC